MPYIPESHKKYDLLPRSQEYGGEVFEYPSELLNRLEERIGCGLMPYGYDSYEEYFEELENLKSKLSDPQAIKILDDYKIEIIDLNKKEDWSICRYTGNTNDETPLRLTPGRAYYWPTKADEPVYRGVIDDEEFTCYWYPTEASDWEILEDPTGMAFRTIFQQKDYVSREEFEDVMEQLKTLKVETQS